MELIELLQLITLLTAPLTFPTIVIIRLIGHCNVNMCSTLLQKTIIN